MLRRLFLFDSAQSVSAWQAMDDRVMGGVSQSRLRFDAAGHAVFEGHVSFERNGGFASVRAAPCDLAAVGASSVVLEVMGDGKRYKFSLRTDDTRDGISYQATLEPPGGMWTQVRLPVSAFIPMFRGRQVGSAEALNMGNLRQAGLLIADKQQGAFSLALRGISVE